MATFYYNIGLKKDVRTQWLEHLQQEAYVKDVKQIISKNRRDIQKSIRTGSAEQVRAIKNVGGQLEDLNFPFRGIGHRLQGIDRGITELRGEINSMASMMDWKLSQLIEEQRITNDLLGCIAQLLRIPDSQKQRVYHIEQGIKYLKNAFMENNVNSPFYIDAWEDLKKAENIERKDFITLNRIGQVHLYSNRYLDFKKAEEYFLNSARESFAEANVHGTTVSNNLSPYGYETDIHSSNSFMVATAESYLYAGRACYLQRKLDKATEYAQKAYKLVPEFLEAGFEQAKYLATNNKEVESVGILEKIISNDRYFSVKTVNDRDLINKKKTVEFLEKLRVESSVESKNRLDELYAKAGEDSKARKVLLEIKQHLSKNNYLSNMKALDMLNSTYRLSYERYKQDFSAYGSILRMTVTPQIELSKFLQKEDNSSRELKQVKNRLKQFLILYNPFILGLLGVILGVFGVTLGVFVEYAPSYIILGTIGGLMGYFIAISTNLKIKHRDYNMDEDEYME